MNQLAYDLTLTIALFICGGMGMHYFTENHSMSLGISSTVALLGAMGYMLGMPKLLSLKPTDGNYGVSRFICEVCQKTAMLAVVAQCFIILAST